MATREELLHWKEGGVMTIADDLWIIQGRGLQEKSEQVRAEEILRDGCLQDYPILASEYRREHRGLSSR